MPFGLCNATAKFQWLMAQALTGKCANFVICYVDGVVISTPIELRVDNRALSWLKLYSVAQSSELHREMDSAVGWLQHGHWTYNEWQEPKRQQLEQEDGILSGVEGGWYAGIKDGLSFMDKKTYDSLPLTRWLDKSGKPIEDHPEIPTEHQGKAILERNSVMPMGLMLKSKIVREIVR